MSTHVVTVIITNDGLEEQVDVLVSGNSESEVTELALRHHVRDIDDKDSYERINCSHYLDMNGGIDMRIKDVKDVLPADVAVLSRYFTHVNSKASADSV